MIWKQSGGKPAPEIAVEIAEAAAKEFGVPVGILLGTAERETNFRKGLKSSAGAVGVVQFLPRYKRDYYRYAGFEFELEEWEALRGLAAVYVTYASWGAKRHGLTGADCWRFAVGCHRYGQNSKTTLNMQNKRVKDIEACMRRNGVWYD